MAEKRFDISTSVSGTQDVDRLREGFEDLEDTIRDLSGERLELDVDPSATDDLGESLDEVATKFDDVKAKAAEAGAAVVAEAEQTRTEMVAAKAAADALAQSLGPDLAAKADTTEIVADFERMGLTLDEIRANADTLATALKQADDVRLTGLSQGVDITRQRMDGLRSSSDQSRSVLANLAGNTAQDLGALSGVVGSLGVGIGQMAEYAVDGNIKLSQLASVAGPMAGLTIAAQGVTEALGGIEAENVFRSELVDEFTESLRGAGSVAESLFDTLLETGELEFSQGGGGITGLARQTADLLPILDQARLTTEDFFRLVEAQPDRDTLVTSLLTELEQMGITGSDALAIAGDIADAVDQYGDAAVDAAEKQRRLNEVVVLTDSAVADAVNAFRSAQNPAEGYGATLLRIGEALLSGAIPATEDMEIVTEGLGISMGSALQMAQDYTEGLVGTGESLQQFIDKANQAADPVAALAAAGGPLLFFFNQLVDDVKDGTVNLNDAQWAIDQLGTALGLTNDQVNELIFQKASEELDAEAQAAEDAAAAELEHKQALVELSRTIRDVAADMDSAQLRADAWSTALDQLNRSSELTTSREVIDFVDSMDSVTEALRGAADAGIDLNAVDLVPDSWDEVMNMPAELEPVVAALEGFRQNIQSEMAQAFEQGGATGVRDWAENTRDAITTSLIEAGVTSDEAIQQILSSLGLLPPQVDIAIRVSAVEQARATLALLAGAISGLPEEVQIRVAAVAATDPLAALELVVAEFQNQGIAVPVELTALVDQLHADIAAEEQTPHETSIEATLDTVRAHTDMESFRLTKRGTTVEAIASTLSAAGEMLDFETAPRSATIVAHAHTAGAAIDLAAVAVDRDTNITADALTANAENELNYAARDRYSTIHVNTSGGGFGSGNPFGALGLEGGAVGPLAAGPRGAPGPRGAGEEAPTVAAAPAAAAPTVYVEPATEMHLHIHAGVIGNGFDVERAVRAAMQDAIRFGGTRRVLTVGGRNP